jgi:hypothetical protein
VDGDLQRQETTLEFQEEQLEWLSAQTQLLQDIRRHTGFMYNVLVCWLVLTLVALFVWVVLLIAAAA